MALMQKLLADPRSIGGGLRSTLVGAAETFVVAVRAFDERAVRSSNIGMSTVAMLPSA